VSQLTGMRKVIAPKVFKPGDSLDDVTPGEIVQVGKSGATLVLNQNGSFDFTIAEINTIGIRDIADVLEHRINSIVGSHLHMVRFVNGGLLTYAYNDAGELIELASSNLAADISIDNNIVYYVLREPN
jgi:hypothetical protein